MKRISIFTVMAMLCAIAFAQPMSVPERQSTYEQVDEIRNLLDLDHSQFEKVYSAYDKYNKAVFGDHDSAMRMPTPPTGGRPGGPMGPPPGPGGRPGFGGGNPAFHGQRPNLDEGKNGQMPEEIQKMEKMRAKQEEKLVKSMRKIFKNDPEKFAKWQSIREDQLKRMMPMPPGHDRHQEEHNKIHND